MKWFGNQGNQEYSQSRGDTQAPPDPFAGPADMAGSGPLVSAMEIAPLGEPPVGFDVRCTFDSRMINGYDFNLSAAITDTSVTNWQATFIVPNGYRMIPREWTIYFDNPPPGLASNSTATLQQQSAGIPNNGPIMIGSGTTDPLKSFFLCEENTTFGIIGNNSNIFSGAVTGYVTVYGNLLSVLDVALPFAASNKKYAT